MILTIDTSPDNNPDYEEIVDSVGNERIERRPWRKATGPQGAIVAGRRAIPAAGSQIKEESFEIVSPESREEIMNLEGTEDFRKNAKSMKSGENGTFNKFGGTWTSRKSMISWKTGTLENFGARVRRLLRHS